VQDRREEGLKMVTGEQNKARRIGAHTCAEKRKQIKSLWKRTSKTCLTQKENTQYGLKTENSRGGNVFNLVRKSAAYD